MSDSFRVALHLHRTVNKHELPRPQDSRRLVQRCRPPKCNTNHLYGMDRIAQAAGTDTEYFLGGALGSVRQLANSSRAITDSTHYDPYDTVTQTIGSAQTSYGFTGELTYIYIKRTIKSTLCHFPSKLTRNVFTDFANFSTKSGSNTISGLPNQLGLEACQLPFYFS